MDGQKTEAVGTALVAGLDAAEQAASTGATPSTLGVAEDVAQTAAQAAPALAAANPTVALLLTLMGGAAQLAQLYHAGQAGGAELDAEEAQMRQQCADATAAIQKRLATLQPAS